MMTTNSLVPIDLFGSVPSGVIHLTGLFQVLARVTVGDGDARVELLFDAAQVRGVGLESGARYQARGAYRFRHDPKEFPAPLDLVSTFELIGYGHGDPQPARLLLAVPFHVTVQADGRIMVSLNDPELLPCPGG